MPNPNNEVHVKLKMSGSNDKQALLHFILGDMDRDWPWNPKPNGHTTICGDCGGGIYQNPYFEAQDIKALGKQINDTNIIPGNLKVKIKRFCKGTICKTTQDETEEEEETLVKLVAEKNPSLADRIYRGLGIN
jgi:hypothetical protein